MSGDNDVGGEFSDRKELWKQERFYGNFPLIPSLDGDVVNVRFTDFIRVRRYLAVLFI